MLTVLLAAASVHATATDIVEFGGSRMVGEVQRLERGKLYFKTDATGTIAIDWAEVTRLETAQHLRVEGRDRRISIGSFRAGARPMHLAFEGEASVADVPFASVTAFEPLDTGFWERADITTAAGYSFAKSTGVEQFSVSANVDYDTEHRSRTLALSARTSDTDGEASSVRRTLDFQTLRLSSDSPRFTGWLASYEDNDALNLEHRLLTAFLVGREFYPLANQRFRPFSGIALSQERFGNASSQTNTELVLGGSLDWYHFSSPELDLASALVVFPSVSDWGRVRASINVTLRYEIVDDLFWELAFYDDYDSASGDDAESQSNVNDYGVTTSLGWSW